MKVGRDREGGGDLGVVDEGVTSCFFLLLYLFRFFCLGVWGEAEFAFFLACFHSV